MKIKSYFLYALIFIGFIAMVNIAAFIQFRKVLHIELQAYMFIVPSTIGFIFGVLFVLAMHYYQKFKMMRVYESVAKTDTLTGATSRYACELILDMENKRNLRKHTPFSLLMIDIDDFKQINDRYGHSIGDSVLCSLVGCIETHLRDMDVVCRWGGEEFIVILPDTDDNEAKMVADTLRESIESFDFKIADKVTISVGISTMHEAHHSIELMIKKSDDALYRAKHLGKNRVIVDVGVAGNGEVV